MLGTAFDRTGHQSEALSYLRLAYRLEQDSSLKTQINREVQQLRATQRRQAANIARAPVIHSELEQDHAVRPRIAPAAKSMNTPARKGAIL
jgi:hypothetical protein